MVEAAFYRDTANRVIVQPRVLMRTEVIRRVVHEGGYLEDLTAEDGDVDDTLSDQRRENTRFWTAVLHEYTFSDVNVDVPAVTKHSVLWIKAQSPDVTIINTSPTASAPGSPLMTARTEEESRTTLIRQHLGPSFGEQLIDH